MSTIYIIHHYRNQTQWQNIIETQIQQSIHESGLKLKTEQY